MRATPLAAISVRPWFRWSRHEGERPEQRFVSFQPTLPLCNEMLPLSVGEATSKLSMREGRERPAFSSPQGLRHEFGFAGQLKGSRTSSNVGW